MNTMPPVSNGISNEALSIDTMVERLRDIILETSWNSRNISHTIFSVQHQNYRESTKNQAASLRSPWPTAFKALDVILKIDLGGILKGACKFDLHDSDLGTIKGLMGGSDILTSIFAHTTDTGGQADRLTESARGEISKDAFGQAQRKKSEAEDTYNKCMQIMDGIKDLQRSTVNAMHHRGA